MLGEAVATEARVQGHLVLATSHSECPVTSVEKMFRIRDMFRPDAIVNCAGARPGTATDYEMAEVNAYAPHLIAALGVRVVHMSTDCVYSGRSVPQKEYPDPVDLYGRTKLAGESERHNVVNVRGSFVGTRHGFLRWALDAVGEVVGWEHAVWSGTTVTNMARVLIALAGDSTRGVVHAAASRPVTKADMLRFVREMCELPFRIRSSYAPHINRALEPDIVLPPVLESLEELLRAEDLCCRPRRA